MRDERGFILLIALASLAVLALLGARMLSLARTGIQIAALRQDSAVGEAAADGAVNRTVFELLRSPAGRRVPIWNYSIDLQVGRVQVTCRELGGRINPNLASPRLFGALLEVLGSDGTTAARVTDALLAARSRWGAPVGPATGAMGPFEDVAGLADLPGMTPELLAGLAPHLSVWWRGAPDPILADAAVLRALAMSDEWDLAAATRPEEHLVRIEAVVTLRSARTVTRRAVVRLGLGLDGRSWRWLAWDRDAS